MIDGFRFNSGLSWGCYVPVPEYIYFLATPGLMVDSWPMFSFRPVKEELSHFTVVSGTFAHQYMIENYLCDRPLGLRHIIEFVESSFTALEVKDKRIRASKEAIERILKRKFIRKYDSKYVTKSLDKLTKLAFSSSRQEDAIDNYTNVHMGITKSILDTRLMTGSGQAIPDYFEVLKYLINNIKNKSLSFANGFEFLLAIQATVNSSSKYSCVNNGESHRSTYNLLTALYHKCCSRQVKMPDTIVSLLNLYQPATLIPVITVAQDIETKKKSSKFFEVYMNYIPFGAIDSMKNDCLVRRIRAKLLEKIKPYSDCMLGIEDPRTVMLMEKQGIDKHFDIMLKSYDQVFTEILKAFFENVFEIENALGRGDMECTYCKSYFNLNDPQIDQRVKEGIQKQQIYKMFGKSYKECIEATCQVYGSIYNQLRERYPW